MSPFRSGSPEGCTGARRTTEKMTRNPFSPINVGIDAVSIFVPHHYFSIEELAQIRNVNAEKFTVGLGCSKMAILGPTEDPVTMAAGAGRSLLDRSGIDPREIGMLVVGTESAVDESKPIAVYVHEMLGLSPRCRVMDLKNACYAGTAALRAAMAWAATPAAAGRKALVITTDVAYYDLASPGEPTQGAAAVALLVTQNPQLLIIDSQTEAIYTHEVMDFWRPTYRNSALVDGHFSLECYLESLRACYNMHKEMTGLSLADFRHVLFHTPFPKMAYKAHHRLFELEGGALALGMTEEDSFRWKVMPTLRAARELGNVYASSLFAALISLLEDGSLQVGQQIALFSYGSGSSSEFFTGRIGPAIASWNRNTGFSEQLTRRRRISYEEYLFYRAAYEQRNRDGYFVEDQPTEETPFLFLGIKKHKRQYAFLNPGRMEASASAAAAATEDAEQN
ncbi:MAG: hydroxymethylglutaryl-CoA synthase [Deltaproteobacteria bacterium HGW-Deltaproteobacteria-22]|nr:MAG: hydroxymethylglutaryl-CoA synthase [Deltaproteobacteria bacterium HGW-Deltaproteobacteria-22]